MKKTGRKAVIVALAAVLVLAAFGSAVSSLEDDRRAEGKRQLEDVLRRTAAACYAAEGFYPPSLDYMRQNYGITYDEKQYTVVYEVIASNLMPDITVLDHLR